MVSICRRRGWFRRADREADVMVDGVERRGAALGSAPEGTWPHRHPFYRSAIF